MEYQLKRPRDKSLSVIEQIFKNRDITDPKHYLNTTDDDILQPTDLDNMEVGVKMLLSHIKDGHDIFVQVDSDCDGYTSAATLINYLHKLFPAYVEQHFYYDFHKGKSHGIDLAKLPKKANIKLIIAPDSSSNQKDIHIECQKLGIDVLVIDHHESSEVGSPACIINNHMCDYANKTLSGAGVVYKFCQYIDSMLNCDHADDLLDLVALGIIADVMDIREYETRRIIDKGLGNIKNPYMVAAGKRNEFSMKGVYNVHTVSWYIAPSINAMTRVGSLAEKRVLFDSMLTYKAYTQIPSTKRGAKGEYETIVEQAVRSCANAHNAQNRVRDKSLPEIDRIILRDNLLKNKLLIICLDFEADKALTGLIANKIMSQYNRPTLILNHTKTEDGELWSGSGRNCRCLAFPDFRGFLAESGLVEFAEGHTGAFGVAIKPENIDKLNAYANEKLADTEFINVYEPDIIFTPQNLYGADIWSIAELSWIWGEGVEEPLICVEGLPVYAENLQCFKGTTIKITPRDLDNTGLSFIMFGCDEDTYNDLYSEMGCVKVNIIGKCVEDTYNGGPQVIVEDFEIVERQEYYF